jgi:hypothetical protein
MAKPATELMTSIQQGDLDTDDCTLSDVEHNAQQKNMLSRVSAMYDINGDGELDEAERAMRNLDDTGRGYLTNEKVYQLMNDHLKIQKDLFRFKKVVIGLAVFVVLLTLSNLGTSFAAAYLAKDTTTNANNELVDTTTNEAVSTQSTSDAFDYSRAYEYENGTRRLCSKKDGVYTCDTSSYLEMPLSEGLRMINKCKNGKTVELKRTWHDGSETLTRLCPTMKGTFSQREARFENGITITQSENGLFYELQGDALTQGEDDVCDDVSDCDSGLSCMDNTQAIDGCKRHCDRLRFGPQRLQGCYDSCVFRSCQASVTPA